MISATLTPHSNVTGASGDRSAPALRVCMLAETFHPVLGGCESQARLLAEGLLGRGHSVHFVTRRTDRSLAPRDRLGEIRISRVGPIGRRGNMRWPMVATAGAAVYRLRREVDVLLVLGFRALGLSAVPLRTLGIPCVLKAESNGEMSGEFFAAGLRRVGLDPGSPVVRAPVALRNRVLRRADAFVAISSEIRGELLDSGVDPDRVHQIPNAVDTDRFRPADAAEKLEIRNRLGFGPDQQLVVYTGRLVSYKGLPGLLRVWRGLAPEFPRARLLLVGPGGLDSHNCEAELKSFVRENDLDTRVRFTGGVDDVSEFLRASDLFVFPTENEAFGASLIEAMACGLASVASRTGGVPDIVTSGVDGLLAPPGDEAALASGLRRLLGDREEAARLGTAARRTAVARFSSPSVVDAYVRLLSRFARR